MRRLSDRRFDDEDRLVTTEFPRDDQRPGLRPPRFGLATLMWLVTVLAVVFAVMRIVGPYGALAVTLLVLAVFAHVAGNALGTRLRDIGDRPGAADGAKSAKSRWRVRELTDDDYAPTPRLGQRHALGLTVVIVTVLGVLLGAVGGGTLLMLSNWQHLTVAAALFAILFSSVLGGLMGFLTSSLVYVLVSVQIEALRHPRRRWGR